MKQGFVFVGVSIAIVIVGIFLIYQLESKKEPLQNNVEIQNILLQPDTIKVGGTFSVNATLVNNSLKPIRVFVPHCAVENSVTFDSRVKVEMKSTFCEDYLAFRIVNPSTKINIVYPVADVTFRAKESGTANATVTFSYEEINQGDPNSSYIKKTISKSFFITILDK